MAKKIYVEDVTPLIEECRGNVSTIARRLGVARGTIYNRIEESKTLKQALHDARQTMVDDAESELYKAIKEGNLTAIIFFLKTQAKDRGYTERREFTGADGEPIPVQVIGIGGIDPDEDI